MLFTIEALRAKHGDCLLIYHGSADQPSLILVDGGPAGVFKRSLAPRLESLRDELVTDGPLPIRLAMLSHVDDDHIKGLLDLTKRLRDQRKDQQPLDYEIQTLWHDSFDRMLGTRCQALLAAGDSAIEGASLVDGELATGLGVDPWTALVCASVPQGLQLRDDAKLLGLEVNAPLGELVLARGDGAPVDPPLIDGLEMVVLCPSAQRLVELQEEWDKELEARGLAEPDDSVDVAAYLDRSAYNLASIVVLLRSQGKQVLLTGDARGDDILAGARAAGLLDTGPWHLDVLKLPHHGSSNNVELDFFQAITADHYIVSGDGGHGNPNVETFRLLLAARRGDDKPFSIHLTYAPETFRAHRGHEYPVQELEDLFANERDAGREFEVLTPDEDEPGLKLDLLDELPF